MARKHHVTAIIEDKRKKVLSIGSNSFVKTHPWQAKLAASVGEFDKIYLHAEVAAIIRCRNLEDAHTIKIFRYDYKGRPVNAKPCRVCESAIEQTNIKHIIYT
jgi:deoxycytidylate deaminase